ncbi:MAG: hypothetical protein SFU87_07490 [Chitinophagaceae bacterium]|nr:hypothetical protein [Chitinophagaceae bacterium]
MSLDTLTKILIAGASLCVGAYLTALRAKINSTKVKNNLHWAFYGVCAIVFLAAVGTLIICWNELIYDPETQKVKFKWLEIGIIIICMISSFLLFLFTKKNLAGKHHYTIAELNPIVNSFTKNADKKNIKLLAGDINFFGNSPHEMENNSQYICLRGENFKKIQILCTAPKTNEEKIRYGKILNDFPHVELKYYKPPQADLMIRGRMKTLNNVPNLLIYNKVSSGIYEAIETNMGNSDGALYNHIWELIWNMAQDPSNDQINHYKQLFRG